MIDAIVDLGWAGMALVTLSSMSNTVLQGSVIALILGRRARWMRTFTGSTVKRLAVGTGISSALLLGPALIWLFVFLVPHVPPAVTDLAAALAKVST